MFRRLVEIFKRRKPYIKNCLWLNQQLPKNDLVKLTFGNASCLSEDDKTIAIKPSGVPFEKLRYKDVVLIELATEKRIKGLKPSVDLNFHLEVYKAFPEIKEIIHTHSTYATVWAQTGYPIELFGTTHADYFPNYIPITRELTPEELKEGYEKNLGKAIVECINEYKQKYKVIPPAVLIRNHGCITFGFKEKQALEHAIALEEIAKLAILTIELNKCPNINNNIKELFKLHFNRKWGKNKYYGQG